MSADTKLAYVLLATLTGLFSLTLIVWMWPERSGPAGRMHRIIARSKPELRAAFLGLLGLAIALQAGEAATLIVFATVSFFALREFLSLTPIKGSDYRALLFAFYGAVPLNYILIGLHSYGWFVIFVPVYVCLTLPVLSVFSEDTERYLERMSKLQMGLMLTVFCVSHVPALWMLNIPGYPGYGPLLLLYLMIVLRSADALQWVFTACFGKRPFARGVVPNHTVEGVAASALCAVALGASLWWMTPFTPLQSAGMSLLIIVTGLLGHLVLVAIKRSLHASETPGEGENWLRRIDSLCLAAPLFFHTTRYFFMNQG